MAAHIRHDHPVAHPRQNRHNVDEAVNIVGPAMEQHDGKTITWASFYIADLQDTCVYLLRGAKGLICFGPKGRHIHRVYFAGLSNLVHLDLSNQMQFEAQYGAGGWSCDRPPTSTD